MSDNLGNLCNGHIQDSGVNIGGFMYQHNALRSMELGSADTTPEPLYMLAIPEMVFLRSF
jgi:hypothetical protein